MSKLIIILAIYFIAHTHSHKHALLQLFSHANACPAPLPHLTDKHLYANRSHASRYCPSLRAPIARHTQKEISTKRQMLQYYRALTERERTLSGCCKRWRACACLPDCLPMLQLLLLVMLVLVLVLVLVLLLLLLLASCLPCYALKWQKNR